MGLCLLSPSRLWPKHGPVRNWPWGSWDRTAWHRVAISLSLLFKAGHLPEHGEAWQGFGSSGGALQLFTSEPKVAAKAPLPGGGDHVTRPSHTPPFHAAPQAASGTPVLEHTNAGDNPYKVQSRRRCLGRW